MKPLERLGQARTPDGTLMELFRHDGAYLIRADGVELMSTRRHLSEDRLAEIACAPLRDTPHARVLIGGLGLGFTLREALRHLRSDAEVVVSELMAEVIAWNAEPDFNLSAEAMRDARVRIVNDDVFRVLKANVKSFDAIMLDTDNGPEGMIMSENSSLYDLRGIVTTVAALRAPGRIVYWSVGDDPDFVDALESAGLDVHMTRVRAHATSGPMHTLYTAEPHDRTVDRKSERRETSERPRKNRR
jgi:spermidine synthase